MALTDFAGTWELLGTETPVFYDWQEFQVATQSKYEVIRLTYYGDFSSRTSTGYIRAKWETPEIIYSNWTRFYPKSDREMITVKIPETLALIAQNLPRTYQVTKYPYSSRRQAPLDPDWSIALEQLEVANIPFDPLPELPGTTQPTDLESVILQQSQLINYFFF